VNDEGEPRAVHVLHHSREGDLLEAVVRRVAHEREIEEGRGIGGRPRAWRGERRGEDDEAEQEREDARPGHGARARYQRRKSSRRTWFQPWGWTRRNA